MATEISFSLAEAAQMQDSNNVIVAQTAELDSCLVCLESIGKICVGGCISSAVAKTVVTQGKANYMPSSGSGYQIKFV